MRRVLIYTFLVTVLSTVALAASGEMKEVTCPVCETKVSATVLFAANTFDGADPDFMERCRGGYPLIVRPVTCPTCKYSAASLRAFEEEVPKELREALLKAESPMVVPEYRPIEPNSPLRYPFTEGLDSKQRTPAWVRYDLMAQQAALAKKSPWVRYQIQQRAAWAVRLEENPFGEFLMDLSKEQLQEALAGMEDTVDKSNPASGQIRLARTILQRSDLTRSQAVLAGFLLRSHGELTELKAALPRLEKLIGEPSLTQAAQRSIELERHYIRALLPLSDQLLKEKPEGVQLPIVHYLKGEAYRRLGHPEEALASYQAAAQGEIPDWLVPFSKSQPALLKRSP